MSRNINHIQPDEHGATMIMTGKTGMRKVRLIDSLPDVRLWLNQHPLKNKPEPPLFVTERRYDHKEAKVTEERRVDERNVQNFAFLNTSFTPSPPNCGVIPTGIVIVGAGIDQ